jgi:single-strand DNA-binding protein
MAYEIIGKIKQIGETQTFNKGFTKRELVIITEDKFPQDIAIDATQEKIELLSAFQVGERVKVSFDIRGREYNGRHFVNLTLWKIQKAAKAGDDNDATGYMPEDTTDYSEIEEL